MLFSLFCLSNLNIFGPIAPNTAYILYTRVFQTLAGVQCTIYEDRYFLFDFRRNIISDFTN
jgi:hypothetical protein